MGGTVTGHKPRAIHGKKNIKLHQIYIVDDLIIGALEEGRIDRNDRQQALTGKTCRKVHRVGKREVHSRLYLRKYHLR